MAKSKSEAKSVFIVESCGEIDESFRLYGVYSTKKRAERAVTRRGRLVDRHEAHETIWITMNQWSGRGRRNLEHNREEVHYSIREHAVDSR